jgi:hypothetical protein
MKNAGMVLVAPAGDLNSSTIPVYPAADPNTALRVMATEQHDARAFSSNFSPATAAGRYNIAAPGHNIWSIWPEEGSARRSGTSVASAVVAGAAALVWGQHPTLTREQLVSRLLVNGKLISKGFAASTRRVDVRKAITGTSETGVVGRILDPFTGEAQSPTTTADRVRLYNYDSLLASDATNKSGAYELNSTITRNAPGTIKAARPAVDTTPAFPLATMRYFQMKVGSMEGPYTDAMPRARGAGNATITLDWWTHQPVQETSGCNNECLGWNFDLIIRRPSGERVIPGFGGLLLPPYIVHPRDSYGDLEPLETVVIGSAAADGPYKVYVRNGGSEYQNYFWGGSKASVQVYVGATPLRNYSEPDCEYFPFWHVGNLVKNGNTYAWSQVNTCTFTEP